MQLKVKTVKFQELVQKVLKGASNNKVYPITGMMEIQLKDRVLSLTTTDYTNYLKVIQPDVDGEDFYVTVAIDTFSKLILKTTSDTITMELVDNSLKITGNGTYNLQLPIDDEDLVTFPYPDISQLSKITELKLPSIVIKQIINSNSASLATTLEFPALTAYYVDETRAVTSDTYVVAVNEAVKFDKPMLISPALMRLFDLITDADMVIQLYEDYYVVIKTDTLQIVGRAMEEITEYPIDSINKFSGVSYPNRCTVSKNYLLNVLDRLQLFVEPYDENGIYLNFDKTGLITTSKKNNAAEKIVYQGDKENIKDYVCLIDIGRLNEQLGSLNGENIDIYYGDSSSIKLKDGKISIVISLLEES